LRGAGVQTNRINGPGAQPGQYNGVMLARINTDIALADFEAAVRNLVADTESAYWELYLYYRWLDAANEGFESATQTWQNVKAKSEVGQVGGEAYSLAQAQEQYYQFRSIAKQTLGTLYEAESHLRYLMDIAPTDGRLIRPIDEPTTAKVTFDFYEMHNEALVRNVELRRVKWALKRRELELIGSKNFLLPQLDVDALYRFRGLGNDLLSSSRQPGNFTADGSNAYQSLTSGEFQEWQVGLQFQMPIGFRRELSGVRNAQLLLTKERAKLQAAELELSHLLSTAYRQMNNDYELSKDNFNRLLAAKRDVDAVGAAFTAGQIGIDVLLQAQRLVAQAERDYYQNVVSYNKNIMMVHFRKGSLLEYNGVYLAEGPWPGKAYFDSRRRARARDAALYLDYGFTQPRVISEGAYEQHAGESAAIIGNSENNLPGDETSQSEPVPTPAPELKDPGYNHKEVKPVPLPPQPEPETTTAVPRAKARNASHNSATASGDGRAAKSKPTGRKTFDVSSLKLNELDDNPIKQTSAAKPKSNGWKSADDDDVQAADYREPPARSTGAKASGAASAHKVPMKSSHIQWTDASPKTTNESDSNPPAAESDRSASGWKGVQR
jgi:outer membrane protein TolC